MFFSPVCHIIVWLSRFLFGNEWQKSRYWTSKPLMIHCLYLACLICEERRGEKLTFSRKSMLCLPSISGHDTLCHFLSPLLEWHCVHSVGGYIGNHLGHALNRKVIWELWHSSSFTIEELKKPLVVVGQLFTPSKAAEPRAFGFVCLALFNKTLLCWKEKLFLFSNSSLLKSQRFPIHQKARQAEWTTMKQSQIGTQSRRKLPLFAQGTVTKVMPF